MKQPLTTVVEEICREHGNDPYRMMDVVIAVQRRLFCVPEEAMEVIARCVGIQRVEVESVVTFYEFLTVKPTGKVVIRLCDDIVDWMKGCDEVGNAMA